MGNRKRVVVSKYKSKNKISYKVNRRSRLSKTKIKSQTEGRKKYKKPSKYKKPAPYKRLGRYKKNVPVKQIDKSNVNDTGVESAKYMLTGFSRARDTKRTISAFQIRKERSKKTAKAKIKKTSKYLPKDSQIRSVKNAVNIKSESTRLKTAKKPVRFNKIQLGFKLTNKTKVSSRNIKEYKILNIKTRAYSSKIMPSFYLQNDKPKMGNSFNNKYDIKSKMDIKDRSPVLIKNKINRYNTANHQKKIMTQRDSKKPIIFTSRDSYELAKNTTSKGLNIQKSNKVDKNNISDTGSQSAYLAKDNVSAGRKTYVGVKNISNLRIKTVRPTNKVGRKSGIRTKNITGKVARSNTKTVTKAVVKTMKSAKQTILKAKILLNPVVLKATFTASSIIFAMLLINIIIASITGSVSAMIPAVSAPMAEEELIMDFANRIQELDALANQELQRLKDSDGYDDIEFIFSGDESSVFSNVQDFIVLLTVHEDQNLDEYSIEVIDMIHDISFHIETEEEIYIEIEVIEIVNDDGSVSYVEIEVEKLRLIIILTTYNFEHLMDLLEFDEGQKEWARFMASNDLRLFFPNLPSGTFPGTNGLSREEIDEILANSPSTSVTRNALIEQALSLYGVTGYQLGAKARYDNPRPAVLDCSGYVDWVYGSAGVSNVLGGGGTAFQWGVTFPINESDLLPGDLAFMQPPNTVQHGSFNHVGIYMGKDSSGNNVYIHSAYPMGVTVDNGTMFRHFRRVPVNFGD